MNVDEAPPAASQTEVVALVIAGEHVTFTLPDVPASIHDA